MIERYSGRGAMDSVSSLLQKTLAVAAADPELRWKAACVAWQMAVGEVVSRNTIPQSLEGKTLVVATRDQQWQRELKRMSREIVGKLGVLAGSGNVEKLVLYAAPRMFPPPQSGTKQARAALDDASLAELREASNCIEDDQLRESALRVAALRSENEPSGGE